MALEIIGRLIKKLPVQSGTSARGEWKKQEFVVETQESFPKKVCMNVWGVESVSDFARYSEGDLLKISINIESREYNQRWYTDIRAWRIEKSVSESGSVPSSTPAMDSDFSGDDGADDLPF